MAEDLLQRALLGALELFHSAKPPHKSEAFAPVPKADRTGWILKGASVGDGEFLSISTETGAARGVFEAQKNKKTKQI